MNTKWMRDTDGYRFVLGNTDITHCKHDGKKWHLSSVLLDLPETKFDTYKEAKQAAEKAFQDIAVNTHKYKISEPDEALGVTDKTENIFEDLFKDSVAQSED